MSAFGLPSLPQPLPFLEEGGNFRAELIASGRSAGGSPLGYEHSRHRDSVLNYMHTDRS